jgi:hypothetical protein
LDRADRTVAEAGAGGREAAVNREEGGNIERSAALPQPANAEDTEISDLENLGGRGEDKMRSGKEWRVGGGGVWGGMREPMPLPAQTPSADPVQSPHTPYIYGVCVRVCVCVCVFLCMFV